MLATHTMPRTLPHTLCRVKRGGARLTCGLSSVRILARSSSSGSSTQWLLWNGKWSMIASSVSARQSGSEKQSREERRIKMLEASS